MFERPAHIFALAEAAYRTLKQRSLNSCIVISGSLFILESKTTNPNFSLQVNPVRVKLKHRKSFFGT